MLAGCGVYWLWLEYDEQGRSLAVLQSALWQAQRPAPRDTHRLRRAASPLHPFRPSQLGGTYFRGNWDRHPALFNGGNYRTAAYRLSLCNGEGRQLAAGDEVDHKLIVRLELVRAANQSDALFDDAVIGQLFLSNQDLTGSDARLPSNPVRFPAVEPHQRWVAEYPLTAESDAPSSRSEGLLYVYRARRQSLPTCRRRSSVNTASHSRSRSADRRLMPDSDLWMGPLYSNDYLACRSRTVFRWKSGSTIERFRRFRTKCPRASSAIRTLQAACRDLANLVRPTTTIERFGGEA